MNSIDIDDASATRLLKRMCKAISSIYGIRVSLECRANEVDLVSEDREIVGFNAPSRLTSVLFFETTKDLLDLMLSPNVIMYFNPLGRNRVKVDTSKMFGTTIEEAKMKLDLMDA